RPPSSTLFPYTPLFRSCGEGQIARLAVAKAGAERVVGLDPAAAQLATAARRGGGPGYVRGRAERLPFPAAAFDAVVTCLVLEHLDRKSTRLNSSHVKSS